MVISLAVQADDRILAGGNYSTYDGIGRNWLARINYEFGTGAPPSPSSTNELMVWPVPSATGRIE